MSKGRDADLIKLRDAALVRRYIYWTEVQRLRFDDTLKILSLQEFFISEETILKIIRKAKAQAEAPADIPTPSRRTPKLTYQQLELFSVEPGANLSETRQSLRTDKRTRIT